MQIYVGRDGQREGPFSVEEVRTRLAQGQVKTTDLAWYEGAPGWMPVAQVPALSMPPPLAGPPPLQSARPDLPMGVPPLSSTQAPPETLSIVSLILGILGLIMIPFLASIPGAVCGHMALGRIKRAAGTLGGRGMAIAGLITSYLGIVAYGALIALVAVVIAGVAGAGVPILKEFQAGFGSSQAINDATEIHRACESFAAENDGKYPPTLEALVPKYLRDGSKLRSKLGDGPPGFDYFGGTTSDPEGKILLQSRGWILEGRRVIVRVGRSVELETPHDHVESPTLEDSEKAPNKP